MRYNITHPQHTHLQLVSVSVTLDKKAIVTYCFQDEAINYSFKGKFKLEGEDYNLWGADDAYLVSKLMETLEVTEYDLIPEVISEDFEHPSSDDGYSG